MSAPLTVLLVDDDAELLDSLAVLVEASARLTLAGIAASARPALEFCSTRRPAVALVDVRMPGPDGISLTRALCGGDRNRRPRVVVTTAFPLDEYLLAALGAGASGFLPKGAPWAEVEEALVVVDRGGLALPAALSARLVDLVLPGQDLGTLSDRELQVLALVGSGLSTSEIAEQLVISEGTVRAHLEHLRAKLGARSRAELAAAAREAGLGYPRQAGRLGQSPRR